MPMAKVTTWLFIESEMRNTDDISQSIGIKGDPRGKTGNKYSTNSWQLGSVIDVEEDSEELLGQIKFALFDIINRMRGYEDRFRSVATGEISGLSGRDYIRKCTSNNHRCGYY
jgi:hypothetical protein